jgi:hypothetical protein
MNRVAAECKLQKHHPEWSNVYNTTFIRWTTHSPPGLSEKDVIMARFCDTVAAELNEIPQGNSQDARGKELADAVADIGKGCCVPRKKEEKVNGSEEQRKEGEMIGRTSSFDEVLKAYKSRKEYQEREKLAKEA